MSWSASLEYSWGDFTVFQSSVNGVPENVEQFNAAKQAALGLIASGALGLETDAYSVSFSGHSNPDHEGLGQSRDFLSIHVYQVETATVTSPAQRADFERDLEEQQKLIESLNAEQ